MKTMSGIRCDGCRRPPTPGSPFSVVGLRAKSVLRQLRPGHTPRWFHHAGCVRRYLDAEGAALDARTRAELEALAETTTHEPLSEVEVPVDWDHRLETAARELVGWGNLLGPEGRGAQIEAADRDRAPLPWCVVAANGERYDRFATSDEASSRAGSLNALRADRTHAAAYPFHVECLPEAPPAIEVLGADSAGEPVPQQPPAKAPLPAASPKRSGRWKPPPPPPAGPPSKLYAEARAQAIAAFERDYFARLIAEADGNVTKAAKIAGMARWHLRVYLQRHGIEFAWRKSI